MLMVIVVSIGCNIRITLLSKHCRWSWSTYSAASCQQSDAFVGALHYGAAKIARVGFHPKTG